MIYSKTIVGNPVSVYTLTQIPKMNINMKDARAKMTKNCAFGRNRTDQNVDPAQSPYLKIHFASGTASWKMGLFFKSAPVCRTIFCAFFKIILFSTDRGTLFLQSGKTAVNRGDSSKKRFRYTLGPPNLEHFWTLKMHLILSFTRSVQEKTIEF